MEAAWLTALVSVPLFFSAWGEALQSEKSYLLRSLSIVLAAAWATKSVCLGGFRKVSPGSDAHGPWRAAQNPLVLPALAVALTTVAATVFSVSPGESFWGSPARRDGTYTLLCCIFFFAISTHTIRSDRQVDRILTAVILATLPICLYGIGQHFAIEPAIFRGSDTFRVGSTLGNPVFLSAYLIMVLPLTISRVVLRILPIPDSRGRQPCDLISASAYAAVAFLQAVTVVFTVSRGPTLGLITGCLVMLMLIAAVWRKRWLLSGIVGTGLFVTACLAALTIFKTPLLDLSKRPGLQRFSQILSPQAGSSGRSAIWSLAAQASRFSKTLEDCNGGRDPLAGLRFLVGYGPEGVRLLTRLYRTPEYNHSMEDEAFLDHFHNDFWDRLLTTGFLGLAARLALTFLVLYSGCKWLGLIPTPKHRTAFGAFYVSGGLVGGLALVSWQGMGFLGLGLTSGTIFGLAAYLTWASRRIESGPTAQDTLVSPALWLIALLSGVVAHEIEINFSFPTESTQLYYWTYLALIFVIGRRQPKLESNPIAADSLPAKADSSRDDTTLASKGAGPIRTKRQPPTDPPTAANPARSARRRVREDVIGGLLAALVLANLGAMLVLTHLKEGRSAGETVLAAATQLAGNRSVFAWSLPLSLALVWLAFAFVWTSEGRRTPLSKPWWHSWATALAVSGVVGLAVWLGLAEFAVPALAKARLTADTLDGYLRNYTHIVDIYYGITLMLVLLLAAFLPDGEPATPRESKRRVGLRLVTAFILVLGAAFAIYATNLKWSKVGAMINRAEYFKNTRQWPLVSRTCEAALAAAVTSEIPFVFLSEALLEQAASARNSNERQASFSKADQVLERLGQLRPYDLSVLVRRGDLYLKRAELEPAPDAKKSLAAKAIAFYERAAAMDPVNHELWYRLAFVKMALLTSPDEALPLLFRSVACYRSSAATYALLGNVFFFKGSESSDRAEQARFFQSAATNYQHAIKLAGTGSENANNRYLYTIALAKCCIKLRDFSQAIEAYKSALTQAPPAERWINEEMLGRLYIDAKDKTNSSAHLRRALELAPPDKRTNLLNLQKMSLALP